MIKLLLGNNMSNHANGHLVLYYNSHCAFSALDSIYEVLVCMFFFPTTAMQYACSSVNWSQAVTETL